MAVVLLVVAGFVVADWTRSAPASNATSPSAAPTTTPSPTPTNTPPTIGSVKCPRAGSPEVRYWSAAHRDDFALEYRASAKRPLCSTVPAGKKVEVGFSLTNRGTTAVSGLQLHMVRATGTCFDGEPRDTKLAVLRPNKSYMMSFEFAPIGPGECSAEFEVRDREGKRVMEAALEATRVRLRPIMMTSFAFMAGLLPLVVSTGAGAMGNRTIGTAALGGMLFGTIFGVILIPGLYWVFARLSERFSKNIENENPFTETI